MREFFLQHEIPIFTWRACELFFEDASFERRHLSSLNPPRSDIFVSEWRQVDAKTKQRSGTFWLATDSVSYLKYISKGQDKLQAKKFETLLFDEDAFEVSWKILFDVPNSPIISAKLLFTVACASPSLTPSADDDGSNLSSCSVAVKCEYKGNLFKELIEGLMEAETKLEMEHWLQVAKEDAIRDSRKSKSSFIGGFSSPSVAALRSFPPADVSPSQRTPSGSSRKASPTSPSPFSLDFGVVHATTHDDDAPPSPTSASLLKRASSRDSQLSLMSVPAPALPDFNDSLVHSSSNNTRDARTEILQLSQELDNVKGLLESNYIRAMRAEQTLQEQLKAYEEKEEKFQAVSSLTTEVLEKKQQELLDKVHADADLLDSAVHQLEDSEHKIKEKEEIILEARIEDLTQRLNRLAIRPHSVLRSWRQLLLLVVFMALWPFVLRHFWTLYGRSILKRLFKFVDLLLRLRHTTKPAFVGFMTRGNQVASNDFFRMR